MTIFYYYIRFLNNFSLWFETSLFHRSLHHPLHLPFLLFSMVQFQKPRMYKDEALHLFRNFKIIISLSLMLNNMGHIKDKNEFVV